MLRIPLPEDDGFALRLLKRCARYARLQWRVAAARGLRGRDLLAEDCDDNPHRSKNSPTDCPP
jgi:hypothetical protein